MWIIIFLRIFFWESLNMKVHPILFKHGPFVKRIVLYFQGRNRSFKTSQWLQVKTSTKQLDFPSKKWPKTSDSCIYIYSYIHDTLPEINVDDSCADVFYIWYMIYIYISHIPTSFSLGWCWTNPSCWMTFQVQLILGGKKGGWGPGVYEVEV